LTRRALARLGFAATAVLYVVVGVTAARVAVEGARDPSAGIPGALRWMVRQPHGPAILGAVAAGFASFAVWHALEARVRRRGWFERLGHLAGAAGYAGLTASAVSLLVRGREPDGDRTRVVLSWLLALPFGLVLLYVAAAATLAGGLYETWQGFSGKLRQSFATRWLPAHAARFARRAARFGIASRGIVLIVIGWAQWRVARGLGSGRVSEVGGALRTLSRSVWGGSWLAAIVAVGLVAYGLYMGILALAVRRI